jgi:hypothetical protein
MQLCPTKLSDEFFSKRNVDDIQRRLVKRVFHATRHEISRQSDTEILAIMRGVFEAFSDHHDYQRRREIRRLNEIVLDIVVEQVVTGIEAHLQYITDASTMPEPLSRGVFASIKGSRSLQYKVGF